MALEGGTEQGSGSPAWQPIAWEMPAVPALQAVLLLGGPPGQAGRPGSSSHPGVLWAAPVIAGSTQCASQGMISHGNRNGSLRVRFFYRCSMWTEGKKYILIYTANRSISDFALAYP